jgi:cyanate lyase
MEEKVAKMIIEDHRIQGLSYRNLAEKYGLTRAEIHRIVMSKASKKIAKTERLVVPVKEAAAMPDDINQLREELRQARLKIELQDLMLDIASKELGVDIRKKSGTRQSK